MSSLGDLLNGRVRAASKRCRRGRSAPGSAKLQRRGLGLESLESRQMMASDLPEAFARFGSIDEVKQFVVDRSLAQYADIFGQQVSYWRDGIYPAPTPLLEIDAGFRTTAASSVQFSSVSHSSTNVQVAGVDEADIVETDGEHLFLVRGQRLTIADVDPSSDMRVLADLELEGNGVGAFLAGDRLTVISTQYYSFPADPLVGRRPFELLPFTHSYSTQSSVIVTVYDVADPSSAKVVEQTKIEGNYVNSRAIEDKVFVTISSSSLMLPPPLLKWDEAPPDETPPDETPLGETETGESVRLIRPAVFYEDGFTGSIGYGYYETREAYLARIAPALDAIIAGVLPEYSAWNGEEVFVRGGLLHEPEDIVKPLGDSTSQLMSIVAFDVFDDQSGPVAAEAIPTGWSTTQYASQDHLYVFEPDWGRSGQADSTKVLRFDWDVASGEIRASALGSFEGSLLNQFSADEFEGRLRVATTQWNWDATTATWGSRNLVQVLDPVGAQLAVVGQTELVAPGESIQSVRFDGDTGYVVTFLRIDPLFTLDLSDPTNPTVLGELKIPGFSGYLQVLDDDHVLGIGRAPGEGWIDRLQVSLFDVSDLSNPTRVAEYTFSREFSNSQAEWDSHALTWMPELGILALPVNGFHVSMPPGDSNGEVAWLFDNPLTSYYSGMALLRVDLEDSGAGSSLTLAGIVEQEGANRSVRIGSTIYSISGGEVAAIDPADPTRAAEILVLPEYSNYEWPLIYVGMPMWIGVDPIRIEPLATADEKVDDAKVDEAKLDDAGSEPTSRDSEAWAADSPSPWDDALAADASRVAVEALSEHLSVASDRLRLITIEASSTGFNIVLGSGDERYAFGVDYDGQDMAAELLDDRFEFPSEGLQKEWHNAAEPCDIDGDNLVAPLDALIVINQLNAKGAMPLRSERPLRAIQFENRPEFAAPPPFRMRYDSSGDDLLSPIDALLIVNRLNAPSAGEGESRDAADAPVVAGESGPSSDVGAEAVFARASDSPGARLHVAENFVEDALPTAASGDAFRDSALLAWQGDEETEQSWGTLASDSHAAAEENPDDVFADWSSL